MLTGYSVGCINDFTGSTCLIETGVDDMTKEKAEEIVSMLHQDNSIYDYYVIPPLEVVDDLSVQSSRLPRRKDKRDML